MFDLTGKKALITGSTQGIGFETARLFAEHGAKVFVNGATSMEKCVAASGQIPGSVPVLADLSTAVGIEKLYSETGDVDILVVNASVQYKSEWNEIAEDKLDRMMNLNIKGPLMLMQKYSEGMKNKGYGRILTIGTVNQHKTHKTLAGYAATKCAMMSLVKNIAKELAPFGVTLNNISPGSVLTPRNLKDLSDIGFRDGVIKNIPCGRIGETTDIALPALMLCSDESSYITGADLIIDGGMSL